MAVTIETFVQASSRSLGVRLNRAAREMGSAIRPSAGHPPFSDIDAASSSTSSVDVRSLRLPPSPLRLELVVCRASGTGADQYGGGVIWCLDCRDDDPAIHPRVLCQLVGREYSERPPPLDRAAQWAVPAMPLTVLAGSSTCRSRERDCTSPSRRAAGGEGGGSRRALDPPRSITRAPAQPSGREVRSLAPK
jgi:hypothetical protein